MLRKYVFGAKFYVSDMFKCGSCGYATRIRVLGDTCTCPAVRRYDAAPVIRGERNDKDWRGGRKPLKTETPKSWRVSIGNQTT